MGKTDKKVIIAGASQKGSAEAIAPVLIELVYDPRLEVIVLDPFYFFQLLSCLCFSSKSFT